MALSLSLSLSPSRVCYLNISYASLSLSLSPSLSLSLSLSLSSSRVCYLNFVPKYLARHRELAEGTIGKPIVIEEFNVLRQVYSEEQQVALFRTMYDQVGLPGRGGGSSESDQVAN